ncbi:MAG: hypothetical protein ABGY75_02275 [Gemmataceae bacterium]
MPAVCREEPEIPPSVPPDLLRLLAQLATLPADQRALLGRLLTGHEPSGTTPTGLDDSLPPGFERAKGESS